ncbi:RSM22 Probable S-adenosyl-L-methionine-dependent RNA methyltransferase RSM22 [Candida maltosa Xu316]
MKKRAKVILSRQLNENFGKDEEGEQSTTKKENSSKEGAEADETDYFGPIDVKRVNIRTKLRDTLPVTKQYDLIMVHSSLLSRQFSFPKDVDDNIHMILKLLAPNGHLVIIERGNPVGFEIVARARQLMIRPEAYPQESGKIPRPYIKGSAGKPQRLKKESAFVTKEDLEFEEKMLAQLDLEEELEKAREMGEEFEKELIEKYGTVTPEELKFENEEDMEVFEVDTPPEQIFDKVDFHLSVIAPCPHHRKCPLQLGDPKYYKISNHKHRMDICSFGKVVRRPQYTMDIKRGKKLAVKWDKTAEDGIGTLGKKELKSLEGRGRPHGNDTESGSLSYLIVQRSANDEKSIKHIEELRSYSDNVLNNDNPTNWPRIINVPNKVKKNVQMEVCTPEGNMEIWSVPKSLGKQAYHDARKSKQGDLWPLGKKSSVVRNRLSDETKEKLDYLYLTNKKTFKKEQKKKHWKKKVGTSVDDFNDGFLATELMADKLESSSKYKRQAKKANFDVDPSKFDGN